MLEEPVNHSMTSRNASGEPNAADISDQEYRVGAVVHILRVKTGYFDSRIEVRRRTFGVWNELRIRPTLPKHFQRERINVGLF
jgi:hypothetical protein